MEKKLLLKGFTKHTCSCKLWDLVEISCIRGVIVITRKIDDPIKYVHKFYHRKTYVKFYGEGVTLLNGKNK